MLFPWYFGVFRHKWFVGKAAHRSLISTTVFASEEKG
jgi:hypothetical protein